MRRRSIAILILILGTFALVPSAMAGGWASVAITDPPAQPPAGTETILTLEVRQHGVTPVSWPGITVVATDDTGAVLRTAARAEGPVGRYVAPVTFPTSGSWQLTFESRDLIMEGSARIDVGPAVAVAPVAPVTPEAATAPDPATIGIAALALIAIVAALAWLARSRRGAGRRDQLHVSS